MENWLYLGKSERHGQ